MKDLSLIGFMGCGKSTVGRLLAESLPGYGLIDLDTYIEEKQGKGIPEIFNEYGEAAFRRMEQDALEGIFKDTSRGRSVLSLGGGTVTTEACGRLVRENSVCFYLRATTETLLANLEGDSAGRPMLKSEGSLRDRIESLMATRSAQYIAAAHHIIDIDGLTFGQTAARVKEILENTSI